MNKPNILRITYSLLISILAGIYVFAQDDPKHKPLKNFEFYMGVWLLPSDHPVVVRNPKLGDLQVIDFSWGDEQKLIHSRTGIVSNEMSIPFSEGIITINPTTEKIVWLEYQYDGDFLFEGEYTPLDNNALQRLYTVRYKKGYNHIPHPEEPGWSRLYRETFIPLSKDSIEWVTETYIDGEWIEAGTPGGSSAVRKK